MASRSSKQKKWRKKEKQFLAFWLILDCNTCTMREMYENNLLSILENRVAGSVVSITARRVGGLRVHPDLIFFYFLAPISGIVRPRSQQAESHSKRTNNQLVWLHDISLPFPLYSVYNWTYTHPTHSTFWALVWFFSSHLFCAIRMMMITAQLYSKSRENAWPQADG